MVAAPHRLGTRPLASPAVFVNELDYDNPGTDTGEAVELAGPVGADLTGWTPVACNGATGAVDYPTNGLQNGSPDGLALVAPAGVMVQFVPYEGTVPALSGPADGAPAWTSTWPRGHLRLWALAAADRARLVVRGDDLGGAEAASPLDGQVVTVEGVVAGDFQASGQLGEVFLQDPTGTAIRPPPTGVRLRA